MNANEYINGMADLLRTTSAEYVKVEDVNGKKRIAAKFHSVSEMNSEMKKASTCKAAEEADQLIKEQGLILAMTDDEEYASEVAEFVGRF